MNCELHYYRSTLPKHRRKPIRIEATISGVDVNYVLDVHGRFRTQRDAGYVGRDIGSRYDTFTEKFGRMSMSDVPEIVPYDE